MAVEARRRTTYLALWFSVWMAALAGSFFAWESSDFGPGRTVSAALVGLSAAAAILVGVRLHRPSRRAPWFLLAGAVLAHSTARVVYGLLGLVNPLDRNGLRALPEYALHLISTVLIVSAYVLFVRQRGRRREWLALVDGAIVVLGLGLLVFVLATLPLITPPGQGSMGISIHSAYLMRDLVILATVARFAGVVRWSPSATLLTSGTLSLVIYGALLRLQALAQGILVWGSLIELLWFFWFAALGLAALVPSMAKVGTREYRTDENSVTSLVLVALSALVPFAVLLSNPVERGPGPATAFGVAAAAMLALVLVRLTVGALRLRRSLSQSQAIGEASARLVAAADVAAIESAVLLASSRLFSPRSTFSVRLALGEGNGAGWRCGAPAGDGSGDGAATARSTAEPQTELRIPLRVPGPEGSVESVGALVAHAPVPTLATTRHALEVVAAQASLALARVRLTEEVINTRRDEYFRALVQNSTDVILIIERDLRIRYASPSAVKMFETSPVDGQRLPELLDAVDQAAAEQLLTNIYSGDVDAAADTVRTDWRLDGQDERRVDVSVLDRRSEAAIRGVVVTLRDVTDQRKLEERLTMQALHDPLTGVGNRSLFTAGVESAMPTTRDDTCTGVLFIDLDDFKAINDGYGHAVGDALLQDVARRITAAVAHTGLAARFGGDEFAVLVSGTDGPGEIDQLADLLVRTLSMPTTVHGEVVRCGASVGVATTLDAETPEDLLRHADLALYEAKASGKRQWRRYDPTMRRAVSERLALRSMLAEALTSKALRIEFQPIVALHGGQTVGLEALLRWEHPSRGRLPASEFIDAAEDSGLIGEIGDWVLGSATREATHWDQTATGTAPFVSVNVSPRQFESPGAFVDLVRRHLAETGLPADRLVLEITERVLIADSTAAAQALAELRRLGVRIAIDDFGTGYSGLGYLQRVPLDLVKLDRIFTHGMAFSAQQRELVAGIVRLAGTLHLDVVAEGVETDRENTLVAEAGCQYAQGFLISRPLAPAAARRWVADQKRITLSGTGPS